MSCRSCELFRQLGSQKRSAFRRSTAQRSGRGEDCHTDATGKHSLVRLRRCDLGVTAARSSDSGLRFAAPQALAA